MSEERKTNDGENLRAITKALIIREIFDAILISLELKDILRIQAVHTHWRDTITKSPIIQKALFLAPSTNPNQQPELNPLLASLFPTLFTLTRPKEPYHLSNLYPIIHLPWFSDSTQRERTMRPDASWRKMYPVQPPAKLDLIKIHSHDGCLYKRGTLFPARLGEAYQRQQDEGIRMSLLYDIIVYLESLHSDAKFFVHWRMFRLVGEEGPNDCWYKKAGYKPLLASAEEGEVESSIVLYHDHDSAYCNPIKQPCGLSIGPDFALAMEKEPETLFEVEMLPEDMDWDEYIPAERREELESRGRVGDYTNT